jgi:hypothetical protein
VRRRELGRIYPKLYTVGVDLGQAQDPTAVVVETELTKRVFEDGWSSGLQEAVERSEHRVRHAERLPLGLPYPEQVAHVRGIMMAPELPRGAELVVDMTGVGRPVFEMFERDGLRPVGVQITAGLDETLGEHRREHRVPKITLVSRLQAALHAGELKFAAGLAEEGALRQELGDFRMRFTDAGRAQFGAREGRHDDLVLALAVALWRAQRHARGPVLAQMRMHGL